MTRSSIKHFALAVALGVGLGAGSAQAATLTWALGSGGDWDTTTENWTGDATTFVSDGSQDVIFDNAAGGTIAILSDMAPASTTVSAGNYTFSGGPLAGSGALTKDGSGMLRIDDLVPGTGDVVQNTYSGGTIMNSGTLHLGGMFNGISPDCRGALGTGPVTLNGGTIEFDRYTETNALTANGGTLYSTNGWGASWNGPITLNADLTMRADYTLTSNGDISGTGGLIKTGNGPVVLSGANSYTGKTIVTAGTLRFAGAAYLSDVGLPGVFGAPTGSDATIDLHNGATLRCDGSNPRVNQSTNRPLNLASDGDGTVSIRYNDNDASLTFGDVTATGTGAKTLALFTGNNGNGDREAIIFTGTIADSADSPTSLAITFNTQGSPNWVSLSGVNPFTGPITLTQINGTANGVLVIGGVRDAQSGSNTIGTGTLGNGDYPGAISLGAKTVLEYDSTTPQILAGEISGPGALQVTGSGQLTLSGLNTSSGNTTVNSGCTLVLADDAGMTFAVTDASTNKLTGGGTANLDGAFTIDTSAVATAVGSWTLVDVATPTYGSTFSVTGFDDTDLDNVWTKVSGGSTWTFTEATGVLSVVSKGVFTSFGVSGSAGLVDNNALTVLLYVPGGTDLAALAPTFTLSSGTCDTTSGTVPDPTFAAQNPATYTITDGSTVNVYTVTVVVSDMILDGLVVWLKADAVDAGDPAQVDGTSLLQWNDSSGNGHNAANATAGDRPAYVADGLNGLPVIRFAQDNNDNGDRLFLGDLSASFPTAGSMFAVTTPNNDGRYNIFDNRTNDSRWVANTWTESQPGVFRGGRTNFGTNPYSSWPQSGAHVYALESSSSAYTVAIDGTQIGTSGGDYHNGAGQDWVIANRPGGGQALNGDIAEFVLFDRILSPEEASQVGQYLANKYGLSTAYNPQPALIMTFEALGIEGVIDQGATTIALEVPLGTDLAALAPTFTLSSGTCDQTSGSPPIPDDFSVQNPVTYTVTDGATVNVYTVTVTVALPPVNDNFADAIDLPGDSGSQTGTGNVRATTETGEPGINGANNTVWFTWTAPSNGEFTVMTNGSTNLGGGEWDAMLGMYTGTSVDALTALPGTPLDTVLEETMIVTVTAGTTYAIQAAGYANDVATNILLTWSFVSSGNDYDDWVASSNFAEGDDTTPTGDPDGDGLNNDQERAFGLDPTSGSSVNPITVPLDAGAGTFSYTRRNPALSGLTYTVWTSTDLATWTEDAGADQNDGGATTDVQTVAVTLTPGLLSTPELFVRVQAAE